MQGFNQLNFFNDASSFNRVNIALIHVVLCCRVSEKCMKCNDVDSL